MGMEWTIPGWALEQSGSSLNGGDWEILTRGKPSPIPRYGIYKYAAAPPGLSAQEAQKFAQHVSDAIEFVYRPYSSGGSPTTGAIGEAADNAVNAYMASEYPWARARSLGGISDRGVINDAKNYRKYFKQAAQEMLATGKLEFYQQRVPTDVFLQFSEIFNKALTRPDRLTDPEIGVLLGAGFDPWGVAERAAEQEKIMQAMLPPPPALQPPPPPPKNSPSQLRGAAPAPAQPASADALLAALLGGAGGAPGFSYAPPPPSAPVASPVPGVAAGFDPRTFGRQIVGDQRLMVAGMLRPADAAAKQNRVPTAPVPPQNAMFGALSPSS
jgi:hypothetical protein